jgi:hypothetical protein
MQPRPEVEPATRSHGAQRHPVTPLVQRTLGVAGTIALALSWFSVNIFPAITNDSLAYLAHARDLSGVGLVQLGYRQVGYPAFVAGVGGIADLFGADDLLLVAVVQRGLLALGLVYLVWLWRWWALPVVALAALPTFVAYENFILTEGLGIPVAVLLAGCTTHAVALLAGRPGFDRLPFGMFRGRERPVLAVLVGVACFLAFCLLTIRFTYAVFGAAPAAIALAAWLQPSVRLRRVVAVGLLSFMVAAGVFTVAVSLENRRDVGVISPSARTTRVEYWAAWQVAFVLHPENAADKSLAEFYDGGSPYRTITRIDATGTIAEQDAKYSALIDDLLARTGMSRGHERWSSFAGALRGGRLDDLLKFVRHVEAATPPSLGLAIHQNTLSRTHGQPAFEKEFHEGQPVGAVVTDGFGLGPLHPYFTHVLRLLLPLSLLALLLALTRRFSSAMALAGLLPTLVLGMAAGVVLADNVRFLIVSSVWGVAMGAPTVSELLRQRAGGQGDVPGQTLRSSSRAAVVPPSALLAPLFCIRRPS